MFFFFFFFNKEKRGVSFQNLEVLSTKSSELPLETSTLIIFTVADQNYQLC